MPTTVLLIRHGENDWVKAKRLAGRLPDVHLNENGRAQSRRLAARLAHWPVAAIYSSPLERCHETAAILAAAHKLSVLHHGGLLETDYGHWQGQSLEALMKEELWKLILAAPGSVHFPGGEAMLTMQYRMVQALHEIVAGHPDQIVLVCSHADPIKAALAHCLGVHFDHFQRLSISPASASMIVFGRYGPHVLCMNDTGDLNPPPQPETA